MTRVGKAAREKEFPQELIGRPAQPAAALAAFAIDRLNNLDDSGTKDSKIG
jgi:hypothetical protein